MDRRAKCGSTLRAAQSADCTNPCFAPNIYVPCNWHFGCVLSHFMVLLVIVISIIIDDFLVLWF